MLKLSIELVPKTCWFSNVRDHVSKEEWDRLRKDCYKKAGYVCEICGGTGNKHPVECHEIWEYDNEKFTQTLKGLISLCPSCHEVKHIGLANLRGRIEEAKNHLAKVNGWSLEATSEGYINNAVNMFMWRSNHEWTLNLDWLKGYGVDIQSKRQE
jgi:hypothetical protein